MTLALDDTDLELQAVARDYVRQRALRAEARAVLDDAEPVLPKFWDEVAAMGWLGLHVSEDAGGSGASLLQTAVVLAELGGALAPGPLLPTLTASALLELVSADHPALPGLADGTVRAGVAMTAELAWETPTAVSGEAGVVLGGDLAELLVLVVEDDVVVLDASAPGVVLTAAQNLDRTQRSVHAHLSAVEVGPQHLLKGAARTAVAVFRTLCSAQAAGGAAGCLEMAVDYAKVRQQFGRPIGSFQAIKHRCADMVVGVELSEAVSWDAARALSRGSGARAELAAAVAATQSLHQFEACAESLVQIHGGIGYTWEHDAHLYLRRAYALVALADERRCAADVTRLLDEGAVRTDDIELPAEVDDLRAEARALADRLRPLTDQEQREGLVAARLSLPHLPAPWGRGLGAAEQIAVARELDGIAEPDYGVGGWVIPTIIQHATAEQLERWVEPSVRLEMLWCQMFSEPGAGSDAAAITTKGVRVEGGWRVTGQKVWTSRAQLCHRGVATVRTSTEGPKQAGITMMVIDLHAPGVDVRPLREASDEFGFGEVFLDDVFVPDADVLGAVGDGWAVARSTLGNERVAVGSTRRFGGGVVDLLQVWRDATDRDPGAAVEVGRELAEGEALDLLGTRSAIRAVLGLPAGREGAITKLVRAAHTQHSAELALRLVGPSAVFEDGPAAAVTKSVVKSRMMSIGGGTTEIVKNLISERILGMPREPALS